MEELREIWAFMRVRKKFWLAPILVILILLGMLMFLGTSSPVLGPFIYMM